MKYSIKTLLANAGIALFVLGASLAPVSAQTNNVTMSGAATEEYTPDEKPADSSSLMLNIIMAAIAFAAWGSLPYMIWVLKEEKKRQYAPIAIPEGSLEPGDAPSTLSPACEGILEWQAGLTKREIKGYEQPVPVITSRQEVDKGYELLAQLMAQKDGLNSASLRLMNAMGEELNAASARRFNGSTLGLVVASCFFILYAFGFFAVGSFFAMLLWAALAFIYYYSMLSPAYKLANISPTYYLAWKEIVRLLGIGSLFIAADMAEGKYATVYRHKVTGQLFHLKSELEAGCFISMLICVFVFIFAPFIFMLNALCDFVRNYMGSK